MWLGTFVRVIKGKVIHVTHPQCEIERQTETRQIGDGERQTLFRHEVSYVVYGAD
jgi:hypothetical protein